MPSSIFTQRHQKFIAFIASARKAAGITQVELAERLGKPQSFVSKVERASDAWTSSNCQVAEALGCDPGKLPKDFSTAVDEWSDRYAPAADIRTTPQM